MNNGAHQRLLQRTAGSLTFNGVDSQGEPADPGVTTVGVVASDGTTIIAAGTATTGTTVKAVPYTAAMSALLDVWTATWKVAGVTVGVTYHDVVGGFYFSIADLRAMQPSLSDVTDDTNAQLIAARTEVETFFESQCGQAFVPRFSVIECDGDGPILSTPIFHLRAVRWARVYAWSSNTVFVDVDATECGGFPASEAGSIWRPSGWYGRVLLGVEHGLDSCPDDVRTAAARYARVVANRHRSGVVERAQVIVDEAGTSIGPRVAGTRRKPTGYEDIDEVLRRPGYYHPKLGIS